MSQWYTQITYTACAPRVRRLQYYGKPENKRRDYEPACTRAGVLFEPLVLDTWGGLHGASRATWKSIVAAATRGCAHTGRAARSGTINQGLSVALMRGIAKQLAMTSLASDANNVGAGSADEDAADDVMYADSDQDAE